MLEADSKNDHPPLLRDRSPRPYLFQDHSTTRQPKSRSNSTGALILPSSDLNYNADAPDSRRSSAPENTGSESGTEADDERPQLLKALPPATIRPRKGLKHSDGSVSPLLTPTQLDWQGRKLSQSYFDDKRRSRKARDEDESIIREERRQFESRRRAERVRRLSEAALLGAIGVVSVYGNRLWQLSWPWYFVEILSQVSAIAGLIAFYPLRLVSVEADRGHVHIWSRFRIPPSFDPASVLYPTFVPVLVSLALIRPLPELFLSNLVLGLASLPPRLFPTWARDADVNALHWMVSIVPAVASRGLYFLARKFPTYLSDLEVPQSAASMPTDVILLLFPLHQALIPAVHYLTTSSLLPAEKQMLSTALVNLLLFATSPQVVILRSVIWIGGVIGLLACTRVLQWNVALARVPTWRLRDFRRTNRKTSLISETLEELVSTISHLLRRSQTDSHDGSDADEDDPKMHQRRTPSLITTFTFHEKSSEPFSAVDQSPNGHLKPWDMERRDSKSSGFQRRNTIATSPRIDTFDHQVKGPLAIRRHRSRRKDWVLALTPFRATLRKRFYAAYIYLSLILIVLLPVRIAVAQQALSNAEPVSWAIDYLFSGLPSLLTYLRRFNIPTFSVEIRSLLATSPTIPAIRAIVGEANTRLFITAWYVLVLGVGLTAVLILSPVIEVDTRRKIFHGIMVSMFLPTIYIDPCFCALALGLVLAVFLILEVIRAGQVPPLGTAIGRFVAPYVDGRDLRGPMVVSHVFLLVGCAIPFWLSMAAFQRTETGRWSGWELEGEKREVAMLSGVVCVGMGDAAASLVGRRYGRRKWIWIGGKSLEGSAAFAVAVVVGLSFAKVWLRLGGWNDVNALYDLGFLKETGLFLVKASIAGCGASFLEAVLTGANDNVMVPVALWLLCRGLRI